MSSARAGLAGPLVSVVCPSEAEIALLRGLVAVPSPSGEERPAADWLLARLGEMGVAARLDQVGNVIGAVEPTAGAGASQGPIYLLGHIDTVAGFWEPRESGGTLWGRGSSDAKGPLCAFVAAAVRARESRRLRRRVLILGAVEEETTSRGARHLAASLPPPAFLVVGEPSGSGRVVLGYMGSLRCRVEVGRSVAHTSGPNPTAAELAIETWSSVRRLVDRLNAGRRGFGAVQPHLLGFGTVSDGLTETAALDLSFRLPVGLPCQQMLLHLRQLEPRASWRGDGGEDAVVVPRCGPLPAAFAQAIRAAGGDPGWQRRLATSDLNVVMPAWRCPAVVYGPGDSRSDHTPTEAITLADYGRAIGVLTSVLGSL